MKKEYNPINNFIEHVQTAENNSNKITGDEFKSIAESTGLIMNP